MREDERVTAGDRPTKKSMVEALPEDTMMYALSTIPIHVARCSTKHEPGDKRRALYADNDLCYVITAYASTHAEKEMSIGGCCARQTPDDFMKWARAHSRLNGYWLSADFTDYNAEHTLTELRMLDTIRTQEWNKRTTKHALSKALASLWSAQSHDLTFAIYPDIGQRRSIQGLYSGSRDTMRNNTCLHYAHSYIALEDAKFLGYATSLAGEEAIYFAGDDEDACFRDCVGALVHAKMLSLEGHGLNPRKQLAGKETHEFLQTMAHPLSDAQRPLAAILATLASGNWYVREGNWYGANLTAVADNWWEAAARGLPYPVAHHLATCFLDSLMRARVKDKLIKLEWWSTRTDGKYHHLWGTRTKAAPALKYKAHASSKWPSLASDSWLKLHRKLLSHVPERKVQLYRNDLLTASHGPAIHRYTQKSIEDEVGEAWPRRQSRTYTCPRDAIAPGHTIEEMARMGEMYTGRSHPKSEDELGARLGVDPAIQGLLGSWNRLGPYIPGRRWAAFESVIEPRLLTPRAAASNWAFRSWASTLDEYSPELHEDALGRHRIQLKAYVYAANGAGKTYLMNNNAGWADVDSLAAPIGMDKPKYGRGLERYCKRRNFITLVLKRAILEDTTVLLGQWDPAEVTETAAAMGIHLRTLHYEPGVALREERLKKRGWDENSINHRRERWIYSANAISDWRELVKKLE